MRNALTSKMFTFATQGKEVPVEGQLTADDQRGTANDLPAGEGPAELLGLQPTANPGKMYRIFEFKAAKDPLIRGCTASAPQ